MESLEATTSKQAYHFDMLSYFCDSSVSERLTTQHLALPEGAIYLKLGWVVSVGVGMSRFQGRSGKRLLLEALRQQRTLACCESAISKIARASAVQTFSRNSRLIIQDSDDNRLAFILSGRVDVLVKGQKVAERTSGQHVGEMSVIDPSARRSATVVASEQTVVAWIEEKDFTKVASAHPELWRELAVELGNRLRQRGALVRNRNSMPEVFIGSSTESVRIATAIERALNPDPIHIRHWKHGVFGASEATIESLEKLLPTCDFAILILTADDKLRTRKKNKSRHAITWSLNSAYSWAQLEEIEPSCWLRAERIYGSRPTCTA